MIAVFCLVSVAFSDPIQPIPLQPHGKNLTKFFLQKSITKPEDYEIFASDTSGNYSFIWADKDGIVSMAVVSDGNPGNMARHLVKGRPFHFYGGKLLAAKVGVLIPDAKAAKPSTYSNISVPVSIFKAVENGQDELVKGELFDIGQETAGPKVLSIFTETQPEGDYYVMTGLIAASTSPKAGGSFAAFSNSKIMQIDLEPVEIEPMEGIPELQLTPREMDPDDDYWKDLL